MKSHQFNPPTSCNDRGYISGTFRVTSRPETGSFIKLEFSLEENMKIKAIGKVKWTSKVEINRYENGLEFWHIEKKDRERIRKYIEK
ncbi:MAG: PilZ domain-containing protein [Spirochaetales bacterium]|nr:PilZ domain-containing protein [Spirochaetales bacterium]